jgi:hypothetical protein
MIEFVTLEVASSECLPKIGTTSAMLKKIVLLNRPPLWDNSSP